MTDAEIVEALATKVMGWTAQICDVPNCQCGVLQGWVDLTGHFTNVAIWNPLVEPEHSKQVREKLAERFNRLELLHRPVSIATKFIYRVGPVNDRHEFEGDAETEERAVALCALKTVGVQP